MRDEREGWERLGRLLRAGCQQRFKSIRAAALALGRSDAWLRQLLRGYQFQRGGVVTLPNPDDLTLARTCMLLGVDPETGLAMVGRRYDPALFTAADRDQELADIEQELRSIADRLDRLRSAAPGGPERPSGDSRRPRASARRDDR